MTSIISRTTDKFLRVSNKKKMVAVNIDGFDGNGSGGGGGGGIPEAPENGQQYGRQDKQWTLIPDIPLPDGITYGDYLYWDNSINEWKRAGESVHLGTDAGKGQDVFSVAIGADAGNTGQGRQSISIGYEAGMNDLPPDSIAIGYQSGKFCKKNSEHSIFIGTRAGEFHDPLVESNGKVAIGYEAGMTYQSRKAIAIGNAAGSQSQKDYAVAIGNSAGQDYQGIGSVAIGYVAGYDQQGTKAVAIGNYAGALEQKQNAIAIGENAGQNIQGTGSIGIGLSAGFTNQVAYGIAIGALSGHYNQQDYATAIGTFSGFTGQGEYSVAIGYQAGQTNQQEKCIALGYQAGSTSQPNKSFFIGTECIRNQPGSKSLFYEPTSGEISYDDSSGGFVTIDYIDKRFLELASLNSLLTWTINPVTFNNTLSVLTIPNSPLTDIVHKPIVYVPELNKVFMLGKDEVVSMTDDALTSEVLSLTAAGINTSFSGIGWSGMVYHPISKKIYCCPTYSQQVLEIDPHVPLNSSAVKTYDIGTMTGGWFYWGATLAKNNCVYCMGRDQSNILKIDPTSNPSNPTITKIDRSGFFSQFPFSELKLHPNGKLYATPCRDNILLELDPENSDAITTYTVPSAITGGGNNNKWTGSCVGANGKIYSFSLTATDGVLVTDVSTSPPTFSTMKFDTISNVPNTTTFYSSPVLAPNDHIYIVSFSSPYGLVELEFDYETQEYIIVNEFKSVTSRFQSAVNLPTGMTWFLDTIGNDILQLDTYSNNPSLVTPRSISEYYNTSR